MYYSLYKHNEARWRLFQKRTVLTTLDIYVFIQSNDFFVIVLFQW